MNSIEIDDIVQELKQRIHERRVAGEYPEGLELQLEAEFKGMMRAVDRNEVDTSRLVGLAGSINGATHAVSSEVGTDSRLPGGSSAHAVIGRVVERHTGPLAESVRHLGFTIATAVDETRRLFEAQNAADERQLHDAISGVLDRLAVLDHLVEISRDLDERVARLETRALPFVIEVHQIIVGASPGDAITQMALNIRSELRTLGPSEIFARYRDAGVEDDIYTLETLPVGRPGNVVLYHASFGDPEVTRVLLRRPEQLGLVYHNITPSKYFVQEAPSFASGLEWGRHELELLLGRTALNIADSEYNAAELRGLGFRDVHVVPMGIDPNRLTNTAPCSTMVRELRTTMMVPFVLNVSQILPHKRQDVLLQAVHILQSCHGLDIGLVLVGSGRSPIYDAALAKKSRRLRIRHVWFAGARPDNQLAALFRSASVFASASEHEGLGIPPLEAMAFGVPVVVRDAGATAETVGRGAMVLPNDAGPLMFAEAIRTMIERGDVRSNLTSRGYERLTDLADSCRGTVDRWHPGGEVEGPVRLLYTVQRYGSEIVGGSEAACRMFAEQLVQRGHHVEVVTSCARRYTDWADEYDPGTTTINGVVVHRLPVVAERTDVEFGPLNEWTINGPRPMPLFQQHRWTQLMGPQLLGYRRWLAREASRFDCAIHMTYLYGSTTTGLAVTAGRLPTILQPTAHDEPALWVRRYDTLFRLADAFLFFTPEERDIVVGRFDFKPEGSVAGIGMDIHPPTTSDAFRRQFGLGDDPYLLYVGRIDRAKGAAEAVEFFRAYKDRNPGPLKFLLAGEAVFELAAHPDIVELGFLDEETKRGALAGCLALFQPSYFESFSIVLCEAWLQRRPALVQARSEVLAGQARRSGAAIPYGGFAEFEAALDLLMDRPEFADALGNNGREYVERSYGWPAVIDIVEQTVERATSRFERRQRQPWTAAAAHATRA